MKLGRASIVRVPRAGGAVETYVAKTEVARGLAVDGDTLYWGEIGIVDDAAHGTEKLGRVMAFSGGKVRELARFVGTPNHIVFDAETVYVLSIGVYGDTAIDTKLGAIIAVSKAGGPLVVLADHLTRIDNLAIDATSVYWTGNDGSFWSVPKSGHKPPAPASDAPISPGDHGSVFERVLDLGHDRYRATTVQEAATITVEPI